MAVRWPTKSARRPKERETQPMGLDKINKRGGNNSNPSRGSVTDQVLEEKVSEGSLSLAVFFTLHYNIILYYTILYYTIIYHTKLYYIIPNYTILYSTNILYCTTLHYNILYILLEASLLASRQASPRRMASRKKLYEGPL